MRIDDHPQWVADVDAVMTVLPELPELAGKSVLVTGATGLICSALIDILLRYNETHDRPIAIFAAGRREEGMRNRFGSYCEKPYFHYVFFDAAKGGNTLRFSCDYVIHGAGNATPDKIMTEPVETLQSNFSGLLELLRFAKHCCASRVLYISSSEVYGNREGGKPYREHEYGAIDPLHPRSAYAVGKRAAEALCVSYAMEYGVETVIARPGHIYGPTASEKDTRIASAWAYEAARGHDLVMKSDGRQVRSYCYCLDCASAMLKILLRGASGHAYNISNPDSVISIQEMARIIAAAGQVNLLRQEADTEEKRRFNPMTCSALDSQALEKLGWRGMFSAEQGFRHTIQMLRDMLP